MTFDQQIADLCVLHDLECLDVALHRRPNGTSFWCATVHANSIVGSSRYDEEAQGSATGAIKSAIASLNERRNKPAVFAQLEAMAA